MTGGHATLILSQAIPQLMPPGTQLPGAFLATEAFSANRQLMIRLKRGIVVIACLGRLEILEILASGCRRQFSVQDGVSAALAFFLSTARPHI